MSCDHVFPIDLFNLNGAQIIHYLNNFEEKYSKETSRDGKDAVRNRWKAISMVAKAYRINYENWNYVPPKKAKPKHKIIPLLIDVYRLIHFGYSKIPEINALWQYQMFHGFTVGWRSPSEPAILKLDDVNVDDWYINFYQPKVDSWRFSDLEPEVMKYSNRMSFKNWIDKWRPKFVSQYSGEYVYLEPKSGRPWNKGSLRNSLNKMGKMVWPNFHPYVFRDWCYIARLIQHDFRIQLVKDWFDHDEYSSVAHYTKDAKKYYRLAKYDWIRSILKFHNMVKEENGLNRKKADNRPFQLENKIGSNGNPRGSVPLSLGGNLTNHLIF